MTLSKPPPRCRMAGHPGRGSRHISGAVVRLATHSPSPASKPNSNPNPNPNPNPFRTSPEPGRNRPRNPAAEPGLLFEEWRKRTYAKYGRVRPDELHRGTGTQPVAEHGSQMNAPSPIWHRPGRHHKRSAGRTGTDESVRNGRPPDMVT